MDEKRIYVQMAPDEASRQQLVEIGQSLPAQKSGRLLPEHELHMTVIHFGKSRDVFAAIRRAIEISDEDFGRHLENYIQRTRAVMTDDSYTLTPIEYARFGARQTTLVARYEAPAELHEIHARAYGELIWFLEACGIPDTQAFARADPNFTFAGTLSPHFTIYKGYDGPDPTLPLPRVDVRFMQLEYEP